MIFKSEHKRVDEHNVFLNDFKNLCEWKHFLNDFEKNEHKTNFERF